MISPDEALRMILENVRPLPEEGAPLLEALDRVLARDVFAGSDLPSFDNSAMDGYAVRAADCARASKEAPVTLKVRAVVKAGASKSAGARVGPGEAVRIMTGAPIPPGADAVVMQEVTEPGEWAGDGAPHLEGDDREVERRPPERSSAQGATDRLVRVLEAPEPGDHLRRRGEDIRQGDLALAKGTLVRPYEVALLAALGVARVSVIRRPRVSILATGDELVEASDPTVEIGDGAPHLEGGDRERSDRHRGRQPPMGSAERRPSPLEARHQPERSGAEGATEAVEVADPREPTGSIVPLAAGKIRNSNGPALAALVTRWGAVPLQMGIVPDDPGRLRAALEKALDADIVLVSGGVSVGDFDYTKSLLEDMGLKVVFWKAAIKPGKPLLFGLLESKKCKGDKGGKPVFGLPGNPVSVLVCAEEFVRPAIERLKGYFPRHPSYHLDGALENEYRKEEGRQQYVFCRASRSQNGFALHVIRPQGSAMLGMASKANALALAPIGVKFLKKGTKLSFRWLK